jgi:hypothetical protein
MKTPSSIPTLIVGAGLLLFAAGCTPDATDVTQPSFAGAASQLVPFNGSMAGTAAGVNAPDLPVVCVRRIDFAAAGNLTHLGLSTMVGANCNTVTRIEFPTAYVSASDGKAIIEAANGDLLYFDYTGTFASNLNCTALNELDFALIITGGTGRFEGASGTASVTGTQIPGSCPADHHPPRLSFDLMFDGEISSVGSLK